jgi:hypothetical protein
MQSSKVHGKIKVHPLLCNQVRAGGEGLQGVFDSSIMKSFKACVGPMVGVRGAIILELVLSLLE